MVRLAWLYTLIGLIMILERQWIIFIFIAVLGLRDILACGLLLKLVSGCYCSLILRCFLYFPHQFHENYSLLMILKDETSLSVDFLSWGVEVTSWRLLRKTRNSWLLIAGSNTDTIVEKSLLKEVLRALYSIGWGRLLFVNLSWYTYLVCF